jgi:hypothetical protein
MLDKPSGETLRNKITRIDPEYIINGTEIKS